MNTRRPSDRRWRTLSATIARFSSRVVRRASSTWRSWDLATSVITGAPDATSAASWASSAALPPACLVAPKATNWAFFRSSSAAARAKNSVSRGLAPGQPPSMKPTPKSSRWRAMVSLSATVRWMPSRCAPSRRVVSKTWNSSLRVMAWFSCPGAGVPRQADLPAGGSDSTVHHRRAAPRPRRTPGGSRRATKKTPRGCERSARGSEHKVSVPLTGLSYGTVTADRRACCQ